MQIPIPSSHARHWPIDPNVVYLTHGTFGLTPNKIIEIQNQLRWQMEADPYRFFVREMEGLLEKSLNRLAEFVGAKPENLAFVKNTTQGVNTIFHSLNFSEGDEILSHSQAYGACANTLKYYAEKQKIKINIAEIPFPIKSSEEVVEAFLNAVTPKTKFALVDHITSATGLVFPVEEIVKELQAKEIEVLVDGAHAPGQVPLNLEKLGAEYYSGNCHKWICSPRGSALLYVRPDKQNKIFPLQISHVFDRPVKTEKKWQMNFLWPATDDYTTYCCVGDTIDFFENNFENGWNGIRKYNRSLCLKARKMLSEKLGTPLPAPEEMIANLSNIYIGPTQLPPYGFNFVPPIQQRLLDEFKIEIPGILFNKSNPRQWLRISTQLYNSFDQYDYLADAILEINKTT